MLRKTKSSITTKLFFLLLLTFVCSVCFCKTESCAAEYTKKSVQKEIKILKKQIKLLSQKDKKQKKGLHSIGGTILSSDPCIIKTGLGIVTPSYYWVQNPKNFTTSIFGIGSGYVKKTNKYKNWNGYTCRVVVAKKINSSYEKKIQKKKKKLTALQHTLKNKMTLYNKNTELLKGEIKTLSVSWWKYSDGYNKVTWKSNNSSVISITKKGKLTAKRNGTATLTAQDTITGKKQSIKYTVVSPYITFDKEKYVFDRAEDYSKWNYREYDAVIQLDYHTRDEKYNVTISNKKVIPFAEEKDGVILVQFGERGSCTVSVSSSDGAKASCTIEITDSRTLSFWEPDYNFDLYYNRTGILTLNYYDWGPFDVTISNPAVLSIDELRGGNLEVKLLAPGTTRITLSDNAGIITECTVNVENTYGDDDW